MQTQLDMPYVAIIPYAVMSDKEIEANAKLHYGCLAGLAKKEGYCWASDDQLAEMHGVHKSQIKRWHNSLEKKGHIRRQTENRPYRSDDGKLLWKKERKIFVMEGFSNNVSERRKNDPIDERRKNAPIDERRKNAPYKEEISKEEISKHTQDSGAKAPGVRVAISSILKPYGTQNIVMLSDNAHQKLVEQHGADAIKQIIEEIEDYVLSSGKKYKDFAATIRQWLRRRGTQGSPKAKRRDADSYGSKVHPGFEFDSVTPEMSEEDRAAKLKRWAEEDFS